MSAATISQKGWIVIPAEMRKKYDLRPGARVMLVDYGGVLAIVPALRSPVKDSAGLLKGGHSLTAALGQERARERDRELEAVQGHTRNEWLPHKRGEPLTE